MKAMYFFHSIRHCVLNWSAGAQTLAAAERRMWENGWEGKPSLLMGIELLCLVAFAPAGEGGGGGAENHVFWAPDYGTHSGAHLTFANTRPIAVGGTRRQPHVHPLVAHHASPVTASHSGRQCTSLTARHAAALWPECAPSGACPDSTKEHLQAQFWHALFWRGRASLSFSSRVRNVV